MLNLTSNIYKHKERVHRCKKIQTNSQYELHLVHVQLQRTIVSQLRQNPTTYVQNGKRLTAD
jgi:hypothetical protein